MSEEKPLWRQALFRTNVVCVSFGALCIFLAGINFFPHPDYAAVKIGRAMPLVFASLFAGSWLLLRRDRFFGVLALLPGIGILAWFLLIFVSIALRKH